MVALDIQYIITFVHICHINFFFLPFQEQSGRRVTEQAPTDQRHKRTRSAVDFGCGKGRRRGNGSGLGSFSTSGLE